MGCMAMGLMEGLTVLQSRLERRGGRRGLGEGLNVVRDKESRPVIFND
jgi:hypothetical protein